MSHLLIITMLSPFVLVLKLLNCPCKETMLLSFRYTSTNLAAIANSFKIRAREFSDSTSFHAFIPDLNNATTFLSETQVRIITLLYYLILLAVFILFVKSLKRE